jgi:hypothetical protein
MNYKIKNCITQSLNGCTTKKNSLNRKLYSTIQCAQQFSMYELDGEGVKNLNKEKIP